MVNLIQSNHNHGHECDVNIALNLDGVGVSIEDTTHYSRLSTDLGDLPPAERNSERFRPPITPCLSDDGIAVVNIGIALRWVYDSVIRGDEMMRAGKGHTKKRAREK